MTQMNNSNNINSTITNVTATTAVDYNIVLPNFKVIGDKVRTQKFVKLDEAIRYFQMVRSHGATMFAYNIVMPDPDDDEAFFYASVDAAKKGNVWLEEAPAFVSGEFKSSFECGCLDDDLLDNEFAQYGGWNAFVLENIYTDVFGYVPVTGEDGHAIVYDPDIAEMCEKEGYEVLPCVKEDMECGGMMNYWMIFPHGGEDEYFERMYSQTHKNDKNDKNEESKDSTGKEPKYDECFIDWFMRNGGEYAPELDLEWGWNAHTREWVLNSTSVCARIAEDHINEGKYVLTMYVNGWFTYPIHGETVDALVRLVYPVFENTDKYYFTSHWKGGDALYHNLSEMPNGRYGKDGYVRATGREYLEADGTWMVEYEDDLEDEEVVGEVTRLNKVGGVTLDENEDKFSGLQIVAEPDDEHEDEPNDERMTNFEWDIKCAIIEMAAHGFEMIANPHPNNLPFVGYFTEDCRDEGNDYHVECRFFTLCDSGDDGKNWFTSADSDEYKIREDEFIGWKSMRG